jgi:hypothetical protein
MTRKTLKVFTVGMVLFSVGAAFGSASGTADKILEEIARYRQWTRVNPQPLLVQFPSVAG